MFPTLLKIGPITLHTYGLMVALGFLAGFQWARREFVRRGLPEQILDRLTLYMMLVGLFGARIFYFAQTGFADLKEAPFSFFRIWEGGLVFFGGVVAVCVFLWIYARVNEIDWLTLADAFSPPLLLAHAIGRLGCFFAGCCFGKPTHSFLHIVFRHAESLAPKYIPLHPTQLYEAAGNFLLFLGALQLMKRTSVRGAGTVYYLLAYSLFRFLIEFLRGDERGPFLGTLSPAQFISIISFILGLGLLVYVRRRERN